MEVELGMQQEQVDSDHNDHLLTKMKLLDQNPQKINSYHEAQCSV